jgi:cytochrome c556
MPHKTDFVLGLEAVLNNPQTSFMKNPKVFNEIYSQSKMSMNSMMKHIGKSSKNKKHKEPTDAEKSEARLDRMEAQTNK